MGKTKKLGLTNILTLSNIKLGGQIPQLNMPYIVSCRDNPPCANDCYCHKGNMAYKTTRDRHMKLYEAYKRNPLGFFMKIREEMRFANYKYFRYHSSGDIVDEDYLKYMCWLARRCKETRFLCFTKKYELVNSFLDKHKKPSNLILVLSNWRDWRVENPHNLPESFIRYDESDEKNIPIFAYECKGSCANCAGQHCWYMQKGDSVYFHKH